MNISVSLKYTLTPGLIFLISFLKCISVTFECWIPLHIHTHIYTHTYIVCINIYILEKEMATHSSTLVWKIPWVEEPGRLQSMGSQRVGHDWATSLSFSIVPFGEGNGNPLQFLPGESHGQRGLVGYSLWGYKELDMTKQHTHTHTHIYICGNTCMHYRHKSG